MRSIPSAALGRRPSRPSPACRPCRGWWPGSPDGAATAAAPVTSIASTMPICRWPATEHQPLEVARRPRPTSSAAARPARASGVCPRCPAPGRATASSVFVSSITSRSPAGTCTVPGWKRMPWAATSTVVVRPVGGDRRRRCRGRGGRRATARGGWVRGDADGGGQQHHRETEAAVATPPRRRCRIGRGHGTASDGLRLRRQSPSASSVRRRPTRTARTSSGRNAAYATSSTTEQRRGPGSEPAGRRRAARAFAVATRSTAAAVEDRAWWRARRRARRRSRRVPGSVSAPSSTGSTKPAAAPALSASRRRRRPGRGRPSRAASTTRVASGSR